MPSFDAVSKIKLEELDNAINQTRKEIATRYDFQGTQTEVTLAEDKSSIQLKANSEGRLDAAWDVLQSKLIKRGVSLRAIEREDAEKASLGTVKQLIKLQQGIPIEKAKELIKVIKDAKLKVTAAIQADQLRITGKNRDDLQAAMALLREQQDKQKVELQFTNFRD
ncbi:MAG: YajQ family cyclic di-GMP-binding protein [Myxococcaceae bacterium]